MTPADGELRDKLDFLRARGAGAQRHSGGTLISHLLGTRTLLELWGARPALCDAGLFHSVYGTESFRVESVPLALRPAVGAVIGEEAEALAFLFGVKSDADFYPLAQEFARRRETAAGVSAAGLTLEHRQTGERLPVSPGQLADLANMAVANTLEQAYSGFREPGRRERESLSRLNPLLLPDAARALGSL